MKKILTLIMLAMVSSAVMAGKTYTPQQLNLMVNSGKYPDQGPVTDTQTKSMSFATCLATVESVMSPIREFYPVETIVNTNILRLLKVWTNTGVVTATCSKLDRKMVMTVASYK